jgi:hypothetical protein
MKKLFEHLPLFVCTWIIRRVLTEPITVIVDALSDLCRVGHFTANVMYKNVTVVF